MKDLSIIIVNFNAKDFVVSSIENLLKNYKGEFEKNIFEIIVVDNNSIDASSTALKKIKGIIVVENEANLGFSKANNIGIKKANGRYLLFLNPDTLVPTLTLKKMVEFMDLHKEAGAATCKILLPDGKIDDASHRGFPTPWNAITYFSGLAKLFPHSRLFSGYYQGWKDLDSDHEVDVLVGAFMFVRRKAGEQIGWWDEDYFFYGEDVDFCYLLSEKGWKIYYLPSFSILHYKGVSSGLKKVSKEITTADRETKKMVVRHRYNAMKLFYDKHYKRKYPLILTSIVKFGINVKLFINLLTI